MDNSKKRVYMDIMRPAKQPSAEFAAAQAKAEAKAKALAAARARAQAHPVSTGDPFKTRPVMDTATLEARAKRQNFTDFHTSAPATRFSTAAASRPLAAPGHRIVEHATVKQTEVTPTGVTQLEYGVIEETTPAPAPAPVTKPEKKSLFKRPAPTTAADKSPFLKNLSVPKRPLSASMPTGAHAGVTPVAPTSGTPLPTEAKKRRKSSTPFIVIIILSILLGVTLGALVYFMLPH